MGPNGASGAQINGAGMEMEAHNRTEPSNSLCNLKSIPHPNDTGFIKIRESIPWARNQARLLVAMVVCRILKLHKPRRQKRCDFDALYEKARQTPRVQKDEIDFVKEMFFP